jgi:hypothetical protein
LLTQYGYFNIIFRKLLSLQKTEGGVVVVGVVVGFVVGVGAVAGAVAGVFNLSFGVVVPVAGVFNLSLGVVVGAVVGVFNFSFGVGFGFDELVKKIIDIIIDIIIIKHTTPMMINLYLSKDSINVGAVVVDVPEEDSIGILLLGAGG